MFRIYFNGAAVIQALIIIALYVMIGLGDEYVFHFSQGTENTKIFVVAFQIAAYVSVYTDLKGLRGRIFFLPVWLICIGASLFVLQTTFFDEGLIRTATYLSSVLVVVYYMYKVPGYLASLWNKKKAARAELETLLTSGQITNASFWALASKMYYSPSLLFIHFYRAWKLLYRNAIDETEFLDHYCFLMNHMPIEHLSRRMYKKWMTDFKKAVNEAKNMSDYNNPLFAFRRLSGVINDKNGFFKAGKMSQRLKPTIQQTPE